MRGQFKIVVPSFNCPDYLIKSLSSIQIQKNRNYQVCVIDDCSTLLRQKEIILDFSRRNNWISVFHKKNLGALASVMDGIQSLDCKDDDVIVVLDGDDWFYDDNTLETLNKIYSEEDVYVTWGSFMTFPPGCIHLNYADNVLQEVKDKKLFRNVLNIFGHLRTFKYRLYREIHDEDLRDPETKEYFRLSGDVALLYPLLEMAGDKSRFIPDIIYVYNINNPLNDFKLYGTEQMATTDYIRSKPIYPTLPECQT